MFLVRVLVSVISTVSDGGVWGWLSVRIAEEGKFPEG